MAYDRQWVVTFLRRLGYTQAADDAARVLPDPVPTEELYDFADKHGIARDDLISKLGGSP